MSKKIINQPENCVSEALAGFLSAHPEYVQVEDASAIRVRDLKEKTAMAAATSPCSVILWGRAWQMPP